MMMFQLIKNIKQYQLWSSNLQLTWWEHENMIKWYESQTEHSLTGWSRRMFLVLRVLTPELWPRSSERKDQCWVRLLLKMTQVWRWLTQTPWTSWLRSPLHQWRLSMSVAVPGSVQWTAVSSRIRSGVWWPGEPGWTLYPGTTPSTLTTMMDSSWATVLVIPRPVSPLSSISGPWSPAVWSLYLVFVWVINCCQLQPAVKLTN